MRRTPEFRHAVRSGRRAARGTLVVHCADQLPDAAARVSAPESADGPGSGATSATTRVGFVVSRAVGGAVVRNRVKRRLRALMADRLATTPSARLLVVRALPGAAGADSTRLGADLDAALAVACSGTPRRSVRTPGGPR